MYERIGRPKSEKLLAQINALRIEIRQLVDARAWVDLADAALQMERLELKLGVLLEEEKES